MAPSLRRLHLLLLFRLLLLVPLCAAAPVSLEFIYPNFSGASIDFIDTGGVFLRSRSSIFSASLDADSSQSPYVFNLLHVATSTTVWSANREAPAPESAALSLSPGGLSIAFPNGSLIWSTGSLPRPAAALQLLDSGNLVLLDAANNSLWQSFEHPTDTILSTQRLAAGAYLSTSAGDYRLVVADGDAVLLWSNGEQQYWRFSSDPRSVKDLNAPVAFMADNDTGLYLFSASGRPVYEMKLRPAKLRIMRLESDGRFQVLGYSGNGSTLDVILVAPFGDCLLPLSCKQLEICTTQSQGATCNCPPLFASQSGGCSPADGSVLASPSSCAANGSKGDNGGQLAYRSLGSQIGYFANKFASPVSSSGDISACQSLCTGICSCLGFFYQNSSRSCLLIKNQLGSLVSTANDGVFDAGVGYIKITAFPQPPQDSGQSSSTNLLPILLPSIAVFLLVLVLLFAGTQWWRRRRLLLSRKRRSRSSSSPKHATKDVHLGRKQHWPPTANDSGSDSDSESVEISIPGLPARFAYTELVAATGNFSTKIGSGGFGEVFKGQLPDKSLVAVKRITAGASGVHGKREFCTEIAVIGNIHHVNLVRLRGFCADGRRRLLVYEFMNRGSLDRSLFIPGIPVLEWQERMDIAIGAARGLAYLHSGCNPKIIHCDVKPENILLHDARVVKIADFGLAKLLTPEQSGLFTTMRGTRGYLAPEWLTNSAITDRTDVYSYGMVLLEIIRGRKNRSGGLSAGVCGEGSSSSGSGGSDAGYFPMAALEMHERGRYLELADTRLQGRVTEAEVGLAVRIALCCLQEDPQLRPTMAAVAAMLDGTVEVGQPRPEALSFLRLYGRGFIDHGGSTTGEFAGGTTSSSSVISYSYLTSQEVSGPR
ncbi:G-type lectin S-receptor-like serine/threonine-protein kinase [Apostasia shenzhenica]|uniref:Receptor-like serine/threonine-protein kinase n=1 Tax=Apostasia shenzhenica TaxID=1088818 RepID=A0A2I0B2V6_9ASPA|nr:G-type lectin S-receptor-like serine/threonine-protein kinase [Apostasia shenzhenica]